MLFEITEIVIGLVIIAIGILGLVVSSDIINERKQQRRDGTHDYYGNKIENGENLNNDNAK